MKKKISIFSVCTLISCLMLIAGVKTGIAAIIFPFVYMTAFSVLTIHSGSYLTAIAFAVNLTLALAVSQDLFTTFVMVPVMSLSGILTGITVIKKYNSKLAVMWGILATGGVYALYILYSIKMLGINPVSDMFDMMEFVLKDMSQQMETTDITFITEYLNMCRNMFVAVMIITFSIVGFIVAYAVSSVLKLFKYGRKLNLSLGYFKADFASVFVYFGALIGAIFAKDGMLSVVFMDLYLVLSFYLAICGASLIYWVIKKRINAPSFIHRLIGVVIVALSALGVLSTIYVIFALVDARTDFRKINGKEF